MKKKAKEKKSKRASSIKADLNKLKNKLKSQQQEQQEQKEQEKNKIKINEELIFKNSSELIARDIIEKILLNVHITIKVKNLDTLISLVCYYDLIKEIKSLLSLSSLCYEKEKDKENSFLNESMFDNNYLRTETSWNECDIIQPNAGIFDRWKIHQLHIVKNKTKRKKSKENILIKNKAINENKTINDNIKIKKQKIKYTSKLSTNNIISLPQKDNTDFLNILNQKKLKNEALKNFDSFPSFPLPESVLKPEINITKETEKKIDLYREEILKNEEKRKNEDLKRKLEFLKLNSDNNKNTNNKDNEKNNKFKGKKIGVTVNGEIIYINSINLNKLKNEFLEINSKTQKNDTNDNNENNNDKDIIKNNNIINALNTMTNDKKYKKKIEIEKNKINEDADTYGENNKNKINKEIIIAGSLFKTFVPEIGVNLKQGTGIKSGGNDFATKYKKISFSQFEKTLEYFNKTNRETMDLISIKDDTDLLSPIQSKNNEKNILKNLNNSNTIKTPINRNSLYNFNLSKTNTFNYSNINNKNLQRSSSLPDIYKINSKNNIETNNNSNNVIGNYNNMSNNIFNTNDLKVKNSFNFTNTLNSNNNINFYNSSNNNLIKASSSFKNIFFSSEINTNKNPPEIINKNHSTSTNFFKHFNRKYIKFYRPKRIVNSLKKEKNIYRNLINDENWGNAEKNNNMNSTGRIPVINVMKKIKDKNILRVRTNINEIYNKKMNMVDRLSYRKIENEIKDYDGYNKNKKKKIKDKM